MNGLVGAAMSAGAEGFLNNGNVNQKRQAYMEFVVTLFTFIIAVLLLSFFGKFLWNNVVVDLVSVARPAKSLWQILGLMLFLGLIFPN